MGETTSTAGSWALRLSVFFGALFLIHGIHLTYLPVWMDARGLTSTEIAIASSAPMLLRLLMTPAVAFMADRSQAHREMIVAACAVAFGVLMVLQAPWGALPIILLVALMHMALQTVMPLADTLTMAAVKERGLDYGRIRLWGSATFIVASYIAGQAVAWHGPDAVLILSTSAAALATAAAVWLPRTQTREASRKRLTLADVLALLRDRHFLLFMTTAGLIQGSHAVFYVFGVLHWRSQGLSASYIAALWAIGVVAEIALFWGSRWLDRFQPVQLILVGAAAGVLRWLALALDPSPWLLVPLQVLHAGTFAATHLGSMHWIGARIPAATAGTAQALLSTTNAALAMGPAMLLSGPLYAMFGGGAYLAMMASCALGLAAGWLLMRWER